MSVKKLTYTFINRQIEMLTSGKTFAVVNGHRSGKTFFLSLFCDHDCKSLDEDKLYADKILWCKKFNTPLLSNSFFPLVPRCPECIIG